MMRDHDILTVMRETTHLIGQADDEPVLLQSLCDLLAGQPGCRGVRAEVFVPDAGLAGPGHPASRSAGREARRIFQSGGSAGDGDANPVHASLSWGGREYGSLTVAMAPGAIPSWLDEVADRLAQGIHIGRERGRQDAAETRLRNETEAVAALHRILGLALERRPLEEKFDRVLEILFDVSWLHIEHKGAVFLADNEKRVLCLESRKHLSPDLRRLCAQVPYGHCLCGQAALGETVFRSHLEPDHHTMFEGIADHGHYCQPIRLDGALLGVLNLYVAPGHVENEAEKGFLQAVADTLAGLVARDRAESRQFRLATVVEASPDCIAIADPFGVATYFNRSARELLGDGRLPVDGNDSLMALFQPWAADLIRSDGIPEALRSGMWHAETELRCGDGEGRPVSQTILAPRNGGGEVEFLATLCHDIRDRKRAEEAARELALRETLFANVLINSLPGIFFLLDHDWRFVRWNANLETMLGIPAARLGQLRFGDVVAEADAARVHQTFLDLEGDASLTLEFSLRAGNGAFVHYLVNATRHPGVGPANVAVVGVGFDITDRKALEAELERHASRDFLTGAFNRRKLREHLRFEIDKASRYGRPVSLVIFDLDHFKAINDRLGHEAGDGVLCWVVKRVLSCLRTSDVLARWGGEEFVVLAPET